MVLFFPFSIEWDGRHYGSSFTGLIFSSSFQWSVTELATFFILDNKIQWHVFTFPHIRQSVVCLIFPRLFLIFNPSQLSIVTCFHFSRWIRQSVTFLTDSSFLILPFQQLHIVKCSHVYSSTRQSVTLLIHSSFITLHSYIVTWFHFSSYMTVGHISHLSSSIPHSSFLSCIYLHVLAFPAEYVSRWYTSSCTVYSLCPCLVLHAHHKV